MSGVACSAASAGCCCFQLRNRPSVCPSRRRARLSTRRSLICTPWLRLTARRRCGHYSFILRSFAHTFLGELAGVRCGNWFAPLHDGWIWAPRLCFDFHIFDKIYCAHCRMTHIQDEKLSEIRSEDILLRKFCLKFKTGFVPRCSIMLRDYATLLELSFLSKCKFCSSGLMRKLS